MSEQLKCSILFEGSNLQMQSILECLPRRTSNGKDDSCWTRNLIESDLYCIYVIVVNVSSMLTCTQESSEYLNAYRILSSKLLSHIQKSHGPEHDVMVSLTQKLVWK